MFCTACGAKNATDSNFCKQCGKVLGKPVKIDESDYIHAMPEDEQSRALLESAYQHRGRGDFDRAIRLCEEALSIQPSSASTHSLIAQIALQQGDKERAIREYERVLLLNPNSIADRIKLEEICSGKRTVTRSSVVAPNEGSSLNPLLVVAACAGLLAVGWVMNEQWRKTQGKETALTSQLATSGLLQNPVQSQPLPQNTNNLNSLNTGSGANAAPLSANGSQPTATPSTQPSSDGALMISAPPFYPPVMLTTNQVAQGGTSSNFGRFPRGGNTGLPPFNPRNGGVEPIYTPTPGTKVHLGNGDDKETEKEPPPYKIQIDMKPKPISGSANVTPGNPSVSGNEALPAETRQAIEASSNYILRNDFDGAIRALKSAQKNPGSQSGKIHQDLAYCYQQKGNKATAKTHYEQAIAEYEAQMKAGTQKEVAESGIRVCKRGIKQCD